MVAVFTGSPRDHHEVKFKMAIDVSFTSPGEFSIFLNIHWQRLLDITY